MKKKIITNSIKETKNLSRKILSELAGSINKRKKAFVFALVGELGGGKTVFSQGLADGLGVKEKVLSPTFIIYRKFKLPKNDFGFSWFYHIDAYRIEKPEDFYLLGFREIISKPQNIISIEWADKVKDILGRENVVWLKFRAIGEKKREITING